MGKGHLPASLFNEMNCGHSSWSIKFKDQAKAIPHNMQKIQISKLKCWTKTAELFSWKTLPSFWWNNIYCGHTVWSINLKDWVEAITHNMHQIKISQLKCWRDLTAEFLLRKALSAFWFNNCGHSVWSIKFEVQVNITTYKVNEIKFTAFHVTKDTI